MSTDNNMNLGRLEAVSPRTIWPDEQKNFTPWLARDENIALLGETIGIELEVESTERNVGPFKADILCKDTTDDHYVLIENQLEKTNHTHMGQLITYAAGLHAVTIVWIATPFRDEHRAALDWLNEKTSEDVRFFGLEVEVWRIGQSEYAPKFNVVSKPIDWTDSGSVVSTEDVSELKTLQLEFWKKFRNLLDKSPHPIQGAKPRPRHWNNFSLGKSDFVLAAGMNTQAHFLRVQVLCRNADREAHFWLLHDDRDEIEKELGEPLEWEELPGKTVKRIAVYLRDTDPGDQAQWDSQLDWLKDRLERLDQIFRKRIKTLNAADYDPSEAEEQED